MLVVVGNVLWRNNDEDWGTGRRVDISRYIDSVQKYSGEYSILFDKSELKTAMTGIRLRKRRNNASWLFERPNDE